MRLLVAPAASAQPEQSNPEEEFMEIRVPYANITDKKAGYDQAKKLIPEVIEKFGVSAELKTDDAATTLNAKGKGFDAKIQFLEKEAVVSVDLGLLLKPFKGKILETIEKQIKKVV
jgi:Putative polyhydroxyalkanoic acid system protein (PHA_gran_rgn)